MNTEIQILLVEDNSSDAEMTINALKTNNLSNKLLHLKDGAAALDYLFAEGSYVGRRIEDTPKVILLDLKMPKVNGMEVLERVKADERTKRIPVVILTSSNEDPDIKKCYGMGANSYIVKPVEYEKFKTAITEVGLYWMITNQLSN